MKYQESQTSCLFTLWSWLPTPSFDVPFEVTFILIFYLVNKIAQELVVSSVPTITTAILNWDSETSGWFMAGMGFSMLPVAMAISWLCKNREDRETLIVWSVACASFAIFLIDIPDVFDMVPIRYMIASVGLFASLNAVEGVIMSLLSKCISPAMARGTFNSGLLATEAGNIGRVIADMWLTYSASGFATDTMLNCLYIPTTFSLVVMLLAVYYRYEELAV
jgi:hypothetical protein